MSFMEAVQSVFTQYATFSGRARRSEYWYFVLFNMIVSGVLTFIGQKTGFTILPSIYSLAVMVPGLAVTARRLHDIGKSGWSMLFSLIPLVGWIFVLVWVCKDSEAGPNQYGLNPKF